MQQIINFIIRNKSFLLYLLLFSIAFVFTIQSHSYHKSKFINSANFLSGGIYNSVNNVSEYIHLRTQNELLQEENNHLKSILYNQKDTINKTFTDTTYSGVSYNFTPAIVIKNSYSLNNNILLLNKGKRDSIQQDFGVVSPKGLVGIVDNTSKKYATVISVLNTSSRISAQLKKSNHFGSLVWNGKSPYLVQLTEIPKIAPLTAGDTIITSGRSSIFPKNIPIGTIDSFNLDASENYYIINVRLFNDMTSLEHVYIIENKDANEINALINNINE
ncbi:rod shape-determining protein MreC [Xanthomarina sp. F2636L]|uniref:rod shape-determining protein MreC n=1 Tax=Xanthomarina sp. F2636L TaxID=2996018 RepID=UPI00225E1F22|nr:rod shape-determining protein MreC [Xanthomarina sp. F2636L]MCX7551809.1 rod shape-determining protein MreC [Xanthomarina sp. F2636L]